MGAREDVGSWLEGPPQAPGGRLRLPETGSGSHAPLLRRLVGLGVDWAASMAISAAFFGGDALATLAVFAVENLVLVTTLGTTVGHRLVGVRVRRVGPDGVPLAGAPGPLPVVVRTVLLCLVIPAVVWDADGRGLHDRVAGTVIVRG